MSDQLDVAMLHRSGEREGDSIKNERHSLDFLVNGVSLFEMTRAGERDLCGCFWVAADVKDMTLRVTRELLLQQPTEVPAASREVADHRVALFVCPECADLGCGAITVSIERVGDVVRWSRFAYQTNYEYGNGTNDDNFEAYVSIGPFRFDWDSYRSVIDRAAASCGAAGA